MLCIIGYLAESTYSDANEIFWCGTTHLYNKNNAYSRRLVNTFKVCSLIDENLNLKKKSFVLNLLKCHQIQKYCTFLYLLFMSCIWESLNYENNQVYNIQNDLGEWSVCRLYSGLCDSRNEFKIYILSMIRHEE